MVHAARSMNLTGWQPSSRVAASFLLNLFLRVSTYEVASRCSRAVACKVHFKQLQWNFAFNT